MHVWVVIVPDFRVRRVCQGRRCPGTVLDSGKPAAAVVSRLVPFRAHNARDINLHYVYFGNSSSAQIMIVKPLMVLSFHCCN